MVQAMSTRIRKFFFRKYFFCGCENLPSSFAGENPEMSMRIIPIQAPFLSRHSYCAAVKTRSKRMTKAYSKISGYDRPHVYVFVSDKKISTLESVFKNFGYSRKIRWIRVGASRIRKKNCVFTNLRIRVDDAFQYILLSLKCLLVMI